MAARKPRTPVYYRDRSVEITSEAIQVDEEIIPFAELSRVWHRRDSPSLGAVARRGALSLTLIAPLIAAVVTLVIALQLDLSAGTRVVIVVAAILIGLAAALLLDPVLGKLDSSFDRGVHRHEIWAERHGAEVRLLQTRDAARFGRIYRALQRAVDS